MNMSQQMYKRFYIDDSHYLIFSMSAHFWCTLWLRRCTNKFTFTWNSVYEKNNSVCAEHVENGRNAAFSVNNGLEKPCLPRSIEQRIDMDVDLLKIRTSIKIIMCTDKKWCGYNFSLALYRQVSWTSKQDNSGKLNISKCLVVWCIKIFPCKP